MFGADPVGQTKEKTMAAPKKTTKDLAAGKDVKGGIVRKPIGNDNLTLVRLA